MRTPSNTYSALFYVAAAAYMFLGGLSDARRPDRPDPESDPTANQQQHQGGQGQQQPQRATVAGSLMCLYWPLSMLAAFANAAHAFGVNWTCESSERARVSTRLKSKSKFPTLPE